MSDASKQIDEQIASLPDWRGKLLAELRKLINEAAPELTEDVKWDAAFWTLKGNVIGLAAFKDHVKMNFIQGAKLTDPDKLFNAGLDAKTSRSIDFSENDEIDKPKLKNLIREAVEFNSK